MEIALTGFNPQFTATSFADAATQRQRAQADAQQQAAGRRGDDAQRSQSRAETSSRTAETARVINGEVLSSETSRVNARESAAGDVYSRAGSLNQAQINQNRANQQAPSGQPDNRRVSIQQALQTFTENEALVVNESTPRQVSGIIDEFV